MHSSTTALLLLTFYLFVNCQSYRLSGELSELDFIDPVSDLLFDGSEIQEYQKGVGREFDDARYSSHGEKGSKGYLGHHSNERGEKGFHDKENHKKHYAEAGGDKKSHHHDDGYYGDQHKAVKGQKGYHYKHNGHYAKGHSTKGHHKVHKLDEFKKNTEFYDEDHDEGFKEKHGGYEVKQAGAAGGYKKGGHSDKGFLTSAFAKAGEAEKGSHHSQDNGYKKANGHDGFYTFGADFAKKSANGQGKQWGYFIKH